MAPTIVAPARDTPRHHGEALHRADPQIHWQREFGGVVIARFELEAVDPQQHEAAGHEHGANDPDVEQHALDGPVGQGPDHHGGKKGDQYSDNEALVVAIGEHAEKQAPQPREVDRQQRQDGAELDQHIKALAERFVVETEEMADQQKMAGRRYRNEFSKAFDDAEEDRLDKIQCHVSSATEGLFRIAASGCRTAWQDVFEKRALYIGEGAGFDESKTGL